MGRVTRKRISKIKGDSLDAARILSSGGTIPLPSGLKRGHKARKGKDFCPICGEPMVEMEYVGTNPSVLARLASGEEGGFAADVKEDGKDVWRKVRKKRKGNVIGLNGKTS